jgi:ParB family chromosome partitioning protein
MAKKGLGKGLGALIPTEPTVDVPAPRTPAASEKSTAPITSESAVGYAEIPIARVSPNPQQPRRVFDTEELAELVFSLREVGLLQPIVVRPRDGGYELVAGERRLRAATEAGWDTIPALVRFTDDAVMLRDALLENLHRANLNALEEAAAYSQMLSDFGCTQEELATRIGRSRPQISNTMRLLKLPSSVQNRVAAGVLSAGHARALLSLDNEAAMEALANRIVAEGLSVRSVEELIILGEADGTTREKKERRRKQRDPKVGEIVDELTTRSGDALDTRCSTTGFATSTSRGQLVIECADIEDLRRIVDLID